MYKHGNTPTQNLQVLQANPYPGRGIVIGRGMDNKLIILYWLMGRSEASRQRRLLERGSQVLATPLDPSEGFSDPLRNYTAMDQWRRTFVVSNGDQTHNIMSALENGFDVEHALKQRQHEPDGPHFTARISAIASCAHESAAISVIRRRFDGSVLHDFYRYEELKPGVGWCVHTYMGNGEILPTFEGPPVQLPLNGSVEHIADIFWHDVLNPDNRVSLLACAIDPETGQSKKVVINQREYAPA